MIGIGIEIDRGGDHGHVDGKRVIAIARARGGAAGGEAVTVTRGGGLVIGNETWNDHGIGLIEIANASGGEEWAPGPGVQPLR